MVTFPVPISSRGGGSPSEEWGLQALRGATHAGAYAAWRAVKQWQLDTKRNRNILYPLWPSEETCNTTRHSLHRWYGAEIEPLGLCQS